ncbi:adenylyltransferase and sulfurtransferase [Raineyella antarctica]|uniref:Adenylyltransferase and sulfurtransferase n=1 Tax=Raineyella antarctica TaxID=1577474 RepID=A0A1G6GD94_9ACTN|nr:molybdopterin-synthase adenylyltransferase MoeB [Raineyella antarctica]SDB79967.1 adenylyltransferase and sulfurtransferase [Raineyella antarctica]
MKPLVEPRAALSAAEAARYARHLTLPGVGVEGQRRLRNARVLVVGAGGLGAPVLLYLAAAGVGTLGVIDDDVVDLSNLQRQVLHRTEDLGRPKAESARDALLRLDPAAHVEAYVERLDGDNALDLFGAYDLVLDGADNFATRYLSNDAAELTGTPLVWGSIFRFQGQVSVFWPGVGPMLRDLFPDIPPAGSVPSCAEGGVFGALCGSIGSAMATEAIKVICGIGEPLVGRVLVHDALRAEQHTLRLVPDPDREPVVSLVEAVQACADTAESEVETVTVAEVVAARGEGAGPVLLDVRDEWEREVVTVPDDLWVPLDEVRGGGWELVDPVLDGADDVVVYCKAGVRSAEAVRLLQEGAPDGVRLRSLTGGVLAWAREQGGATY